MATHRLLVDVHTHVYLPRYASFLRSRTSAPRIFSRQTTASNGSVTSEERLLILDNEPSGGRPVGPQYWDREEKLKFMDKHGIDVSIVSSANPWLDFLPAPTAHKLAEELNEDLESFCSTSPTLAQLQFKRLYGFGLLPLVPSASTSSLLSTIDQINKLPHLKGIIMGTKGVGKGLDDEALEPVWEALAKTGLVVFLHPHYGVDGSAWGEKENGHVLPLALGFPFETTTAITRLILSGVFDRHPALRILLAHSGGTLPLLSSRLASCIAHDPIVASRLKHDARHYLGDLYFDAVAYGSEELGFVSDTIGRAASFEGTQRGSQSLGLEAKRKIGSGRMLFGTDHPFFPPLSESEKWMSVVENLEAIERVDGWTDVEKDAVRGGNAVQLFGLS
ncbi:amidohydrolase 2 [Cristinia sonorae]|uniref:Amidohydrolase 2 n=1 Tax=Cristinia sonorae TaxID=1940300 RepID=A0A8K0UJF7_9AGAR|nr:amidohydrolase 2 [Cristinia sonorae]